VGLIVKDAACFRGGAINRPLPKTTLRSGLFSALQSPGCVLNGALLT
jgi:hypothetical protein